MYIDWAKTHPQILSCGKYQWENGLRVSPTWCRWLYDHNLWLVYTGRGSILTRSGPVTLERGVGLWCRPGWDYAAEQDPDDPIGTYSVHFSLVEAGQRQPRSDLASLPPERVTVPDFTFAESIFQRLIGPLDLNQPRVMNQHLLGPWATHLLGSLLIELDRATRDQHAGNDVIEPAEAKDDALARIANDISVNPGQTPPIAELAAQLRLAPSQFCQQFRKRFNFTPQMFLIMWRVRHAQRLLVETELSIKQIAVHLGYRSNYFFSRQFKQHAKQTPTQFRRENRARPPEE